MKGSNEEYWTNKARLDTLAARWRDDGEFRSRIESGDTAVALHQLEMELPRGTEARFAADTDEVTHVVFPPDPNITLEDEELRAASGGGTSTMGSAGTGSSFPSCISSLSSVSSWSG